MSIEGTDPGEGSGTVGAHQSVRRVRVGITFLLLDFRIMSGLQFSCIDVLVFHDTNSRQHLVWQVLHFVKTSITCLPLQQLKYIKNSYFHASSLQM